MSHELRTPLNAMIGFSEVMLRELHGPLGHARYQEYAAHISESGGRLLKSSEDTLAVTATMSALMADRLAGRRERVLAGASPAGGLGNGNRRGRRPRRAAGGDQLQRPARSSASGAPRGRRWSTSCARLSRGAPPAARSR